MSSNLENLKLNPTVPNTREIMSSAHSSAKAALVTGVALLVCSHASGVLGGDVSTVAQDGARMKSDVRVMPGMGYSVHEMRDPYGTTIREFVSPAGRVFAVYWQGPYAPDLRQLLGEYFDQYISAAANSGRTHRRVMHLEAGDLVFECGGQMRSFVGRAYLRSKLPEGAGADVIQ